jgi:O-succinylbenzoic acid--CoA ligase
MKIPNWTSQSGIWLPHYANEIPIPNRDDLKKTLLGLGEVMLFPSSGTSGAQPKWVVLSKDNWLKQTEIIVEELSLSEVETWGNFLPTFHVGGCGVHIRSHITGAQVISYDSSWHPERAYAFLESNKIEGVSLVPTQVYDLVQKKYVAPKALKKVIVGGAAISEALILQAQRLGWNLCLTFGMTETNAFFSYRKEEEKGYRPIPGYEVNVNSNNELLIRSPYLFQGYYENQVLVKSRREDSGYWISPDKAVLLEDQSFLITGRVQSDFVKVKGEGVVLTELRRKLIPYLQDLASDPWELTACEDNRTGARLTLVYGGSNIALVQKLLKNWNQSCLKFEQLYLVALPFQDWPKTPVGKIHLSALRDQVSQLDPISTMSSN